MAAENSLENLFHEALSKSSSGEREAFLNHACQGDAVLRAEVDKLLAVHPDVTGFLNTTPQFPLERFAGARSNAIGTIIADRYKLLEVIGEGGMGSVWRAQQSEPVKRQVAVKLIKAGMDSKQVLARFEAERQALAMMDHPNIAKVLDGGLHDHRPYFVMELVKGVPITEYCDARKLTPKERLELFVPVCQAIQHAHQKGIIHRDIKPSNVLVALYDDKPVPKVIDFGVAKATGGALTESTIDTGFGGVVGTPQYMSPEQATFNNLDIDTRSDVYSLGVLLYELLAGSPPFAKAELEKRGLLEMLRVVREEEPPRPSTKLSTANTLPSLSANRGTEPKKLTGLLRNELDWIVMKSLEKDRTRRYETANGFAADVQRYLSGEAVQAHPPSLSYRARKFTQKHRTAVIVVSAFMFLMAGAVAMAAYLTLRATNAERLATQARDAAEASHQAEAIRAESEARERQRAEAGEKLAGERLIQVQAEKSIALAVTDFLQNNLLKQADVVEQAETLRGNGGSAAEAKQNPTIRELLDRAAKDLNEVRIEARFPNQPLLQAELLQTLGNAYRGIGESGKALDFLVRSVSLRKEHLSPEHSDTLESMNNLAGVYRELGKFQQSVTLHEQILKQRRATLGPHHPKTLTTMNNLALAYEDIGKLDLAVPLLEDVCRQLKASLGSRDPLTLAGMNNLAVAYGKAGKRDLAVPIFEESFKLRTATLGPDHPHTLISMDQLAWAYQTTGKRDLALPMLEETLRLRKAKLGLDHPDTLISMNNLGRAYFAEGKWDPSLALLEETLRLRRLKLGSDHPETVVSVYNMAVVYQAVGKQDRAVPLFAESLQFRQASLGPGHSETITCMNSLCTALVAIGNKDSARELVSELICDARKKFPKESLPLAGQLASYTQLLLQLRAFAEAEPLLRECLAIREHLQPDHWTTFNTQSQLGGALLGQKKYVEAEPLLLMGLQGMKQREQAIPPLGTTRVPEALDRLIVLYTRVKQPDEVKKWQAERTRYPREATPLPRRSP
ncbi:hypothetical protein BH11PLA2_BH11PLA2_01170 [soil metagenome]